MFIVDDFADQVTAVPDLLTELEKKDVVFVAAARSYRFNYIKQVMGRSPFDTIERIPFGTIEAERLIEKYSDFGFLGDPTILRQKLSFARKIATDPIAVACCRIMKRFEPLERIIEDVVGDASEKELNRYLCAAIAQRCFSGGIRYEILVASLAPEGIKEQFESANPLPLSYSDPARMFVVPQNTTIAERVLLRASVRDRKRLLDVFVALASEIRPRVNREAIRRRTPEARLTGRLFNYDDFTRDLLGDNSELFYWKIHDIWKWNSRYWEQVALLNLSKFQVSPTSEEGLEALAKAVQHARNAVAIEHHPFCLTTLGKILMSQMLAPEHSMTDIFAEAFEKLSQAIELEIRWRRSSVQPFMSLFTGTLRFLERNGVLTNLQRDKIRAFLIDAEERLPRDTELPTYIAAIRTSREFR